VIAHKITQQPFPINNLNPITTTMTTTNLQSKAI